MRVSLLKLLAALGMICVANGCRSSYAPAPAYYTAPAVAPPYYAPAATVAPAAQPCCPCQCPPG